MRSTTTKNRIRWKYRAGTNEFEGYANGEKDDYSFSIQGGLCLMDMRAYRAAYKSGGDHVQPSSYRIHGDKEAGKQIAMDLLDGVNTEKHEANRLAWIADNERSAKVLQDADDLIFKLTGKRTLK